ncbi:hypothetical protein Goklo_000593 [Gossypium klotzschianum]|uniref:Uncharacterized protein n=1 Tax=Gossypium klotzschianum TaxID=34286 RepID=A0A7J8VY18_9ROSI|nr:hypothetical protein [Gossypium klotzschianum]
MAQLEKKMRSLQQVGFCVTKVEDG